jgi:hypothetical protein
VGCLKPCRMRSTTILRHTKTIICRSVTRQINNHSSTASIHCNFVHGCTCKVSLGNHYIFLFFVNIFDSLLPQPIHASVVSDDEDAPQTQFVAAQSSTSVITRVVRPPYGQRQGWKPSSQEDFGGSYILFILLC